jgi:hypothetical protein
MDQMTIVPYQTGILHILGIEKDIHDPQHLVSRQDRRNIDGASDSIHLPRWCLWVELHIKKHKSQAGCSRYIVTVLSQLCMHPTCLEILWWIWHTMRCTQLLTINASNASNIATCKVLVDLVDLSFCRRSMNREDDSEMLVHILTDRITF